MKPYRVNFEARGDVIVFAGSSDEALTMADMAMKRFQDMRTVKLNEVDWIGVEEVKTNG